MQAGHYLISSSRSITVVSALKGMSPCELVPAIPAAFQLRERKSITVQPSGTATSTVYNGSSHVYNVYTAVLVQGLTGPEAAFTHPMCNYKYVKS